MSEQEKQFIDITPTPEAFRQMARLFPQEIERYHEKLKALDNLERINGLYGTYGDQQNYIEEFVKTSIELERDRIQASITSLEEGIAELKKAGYTNE